MAISSIPENLRVNMIYSTSEYLGLYATSLGLQSNSIHFYGCPDVEPYLDTTLHRQACMKSTPFRIAAETKILPIQSISRNGLCCKHVLSAVQEVTPPLVNTAPVYQQEREGRATLCT